MNITLLLASIAKHISLSTEEVNFFTSLLNEKSIKAGDFLLREGDICRYESFITQGCLKTYQVDEKGVEHIIDFLVEEWWADDLYSFLTDTISSSSIKAIEDIQLVQISKTNLELLYQQVPKFERFFRILFQNAYIAQREQINQLLSTPAEERYTLFLSSKPYAESRFSQKDIAAYLGVTPQFLSTMKKRMKQVNLD